MAKKAAKPQPRKLETYGMPITGAQTQFDIERACFNNKWGSKAWEQEVNGKKVLVKNKAGGHSKAWHFRAWAILLWGQHNRLIQFTWHPWANDMLRAACKYKRLGVAGCASSGKSDFFAIYCILLFLANPSQTMILVTSTTKSAAGNRVWGKILKYWNGINGILKEGTLQLPGEVVASKHCIRYVDHGTGKSDETVGIKLVAGEASKAAKSADEIRGVKGNPIILVADEMPELSHSLTNTFDENITSNENHQIITIGNPSGKLDPFGEFCEPVHGYDTISEDDFEWEAKKGAHVIRFDAELSPNILEGVNRYPFLMTPELLAEKEKICGGRNTPAYFRGVRGFWCPTGNELTIYTHAELLTSHALKGNEPTRWQAGWTMVAGFDVSFTHDGDRSVLTIGKIGVRNDGVLTLEFQKYIDINEDTRIKDVDRTTQVVRKLKQACIDNGVDPKNLAIDATGPGGKAFRDAVIAQWSNAFLPVDFAGACSDSPVSSLDRTPCKDFYDRKVSEIWFSAKQHLRTDQIRGITNELACEMVIRKYEDKKKITVETKREMKERTQRSPDLCDSFMCMVLLCRERHKFVAKEVAANAKGKVGNAKDFKATFKKYQDLYVA